MMVACVDRQACCNFHEMVQCYEQVLHIAVLLQSNFLLLVTSSQTVVVKVRLQK